MASDYVLILLPVTHQAPAVEALRVAADQYRRTASRAGAALMADADVKDPRSASVVIVRDYCAAAHYLDEAAEAIAAASVPSAIASAPLDDLGPPPAAVLEALREYADGGPFDFDQDTTRVVLTGPVPVVEAAGDVTSAPETPPPAPAPRRTPAGQASAKRRAQAAEKAKAAGPGTVSEAEARARADRVITEVLGPTPRETHVDSDDQALEDLIAETAGEPTPIDGARALKVVEQNLEAQPS